MKNKYQLLFVFVFFATNLTAQQEFQWKPEHTEYWNNQPPIVTSGEGTQPPSDAIILFDGKDLSAWQHADRSEAKWRVENGCFTVAKGSGDLQTKRMFGSCQLHIEWRTPVESGPRIAGQGEGNSGVYLQSRYELQIYDSFNIPLYSNGGAGSIYKQSPPLANVCKKPGEWQIYDIIYTAPEFNGKGELISSARITVIHNGVLIQNNTEIKGNTEYIGMPSYRPHSRLPLLLQDHGDLVSFRNIWIRDL